MTKFSWELGDLQITSASKKRKKSEGFAQILKANPYHDEKGRFLPEDKAKTISGNYDVSSLQSPMTATSHKSER